MAECADAYPRFAGAVPVLSNREIAAEVFELAVGRASIDGVSGDRVDALVPSPVPGQFFMLRARPSGVLLGRPISVYAHDDRSISFLILRKGRGTAELADLRPGDSVDVVGPIGNRFALPSELDGIPADARVAVVGGGIGVAPVAGFATTLPAGSFDFYASFRSRPYGLDAVEGRARRFVITTEDGSTGTKGMLPAVFDASQYDLVYACGPTPMLKYVKDACASAGCRAYLSLERHMACGAGACLGCTIRTTDGNRRCCVDGPVFDAREVIL
ncbi:MAG TPA: dihydroorotate dehydrogenase electron transfer subunit [Treponemataceae bacterium]|jgi:dihydroorotate dehydrogenase (NAD+) catalytic subunit|nr:dihydroorotate dehydrogenase electron transfer subunit [Treponemataceae bacterium]